MRVADLFQRDRFAAKLGEVLDFHNFVLQNYFRQAPVDFQKTLDQQLALEREDRAAGDGCDAGAECVAPVGCQCVVRRGAGGNARRRSRHLPLRHLLEHHREFRRHWVPVSARVRSTMSSAS